MIFIENLSKSYNDNYLFSNVSIAIKRGMRIGLVGANGTGKTTLLRILIGEENFDSGNVQTDKRISIGYLPQELITASNSTVLEEAQKSFPELKKIEKELKELNQIINEDPNNNRVVEKIGRLQHTYEVMGGWSIEDKTKKILSGLGFSKNQFNKKTVTLSGGWRMRVVLASILLKKPDVIILDEPTNHLDLDATIWLEDFLSEWNGSLVLISHDRTFLDKSTNYILEIEFKKVFLFKGNYSDYLIQKSTRVEQHKNAFKNQQKQIKETERFIERFRYKNTKSSQVQSRVKTLEKLERIEEPEQSNKQLNLLIPNKDRSPLKIIFCNNISKSYDENIVFENLNFIVERNQKIGLVGHNGAGKSTLLKLLSGVIKPTTGKIENGPNVDVAYYAQHQLEILKKDDDIYNSIASVGAGLGETEIRTYLGGFLFSGDEIRKRIGVLSGGEKARVALARMLISPVDILLLDEPTNHLDIKARAILEKALKKYKGAIVCISHDRHFLNKVTDVTCEVGQKGLKVYNGNYDYYYWKKKQGKSRFIEDEKQKNRLFSKGKSYKTKKKLKNRETAIGRRIEYIESEIDKARAVIQNKNNQDNYQLLLQETEKIDKLEIELLELLEEKESLSTNI